MTRAFAMLMAVTLGLSVSAARRTCGLALSAPTLPMSSDLRPRSTTRRLRTMCRARASWRPSRAAARTRHEQGPHRGFQPAAPGKVRRSKSWARSRSSARGSTASCSRASTGGCTSPRPARLSTRTSRCSSTSRWRQRWTMRAKSRGWRRRPACPGSARRRCDTASRR